MNFDQTLHHTRSIFEVVRKQPISERTEGRKKILISFFQCVKVSLFFFRTPVHMHVLTIPLVRDRGYTDGRGQMPKTRRRAGDRTAGAGWQLCCLIDRAEEFKFLSCLLRSGAHNL